MQQERNLAFHVELTILPESLRLFCSSRHLKFSWVFALWEEQSNARGEKPSVSCGVNYSPNNSDSFILSSLQFSWVVVLWESWFERIQRTKSHRHLYFFSLWDFLKKLRSVEFLYEIAVYSPFSITLFMTFLLWENDRQTPQSTKGNSISKSLIW